MQVWLVVAALIAGGTSEDLAVAAYAFVDNAGLTTSTGAGGWTNISSVAFNPGKITYTTGETPRDNASDIVLLKKTLVS